MKIINRIAQFIKTRVLGQPSYAEMLKAAHRRGGDLYVTMPGGLPRAETTED